MNSVRNYILYTTVIGIFTTAFYYMYHGIMYQIFYAIIVINLSLMAFMKQLWMPKGFIYFIICIAFTGVIGVLRNTDTLARVIKEVSGISISACYYCSFFKLIKFDLVKCFNLYLRVCSYIAVLGILLLPIQWQLSGQYRLSSVFSEAAAFVIACAPALYYFADQWLKKKTYGKELLTMLVAYLLSQSSTGFIGIMIIVSFLLMKYRRTRIVMPIVVVLLGAVMYELSDEFKLRVDDSIQAIQMSDVSAANQSTFVLYSNMYVTWQVLSKHPFLGNGIGSHGMSFDKYFYGIDGVDRWYNTTGGNFTKEDANSLGLRILSDTGLLGAALAVLFLYRFWPKGDETLDVICKGIFVYFMLKLLRGGHYFSNEQFFFICIYALHRHVKTAGVLVRINNAVESLSPIEAT